MSASRLRRVVPCLVAMLPVWAAAPAAAATFTVAELSYDKALLSQFNLATLNNYTTSNETEGRIVVGGNATINGSTNVCFAAACTGNATAPIESSGATYGALTVFGNLTGGVATGNNGGNISVGGTSSGSFNLRGKGAFNVVGSALGTTVDSATVVQTRQALFLGTVRNSGNLNLAKVNQSMATVFPFGSSWTTNAKALSKGIAALPGSPGVTAQSLPPNGNNVFFTANNDYTANGKKYGVVTTTLANLASQQNFLGINNGTNDATFVIVTGDGANYVLPNLNTYSGANKVIFDFVDATTLRFGGQWNGTILAPLATITQQGSFIDGSVVVSSMMQTQELHMTNLFTGDLSGLAGFTYGTQVPEAPSLLIFVAGLLIVGCLRKRTFTGISSEAISNA